MSQSYSRQSQSFWSEKAKRRNRGIDLSCAMSFSTYSLFYSCISNSNTTVSKTEDTYKVWQLGFHIDKATTRHKRIGLQLIKNKNFQVRKVMIESLNKVAAHAGKCSRTGVE